MESNKNIREFYSLFEERFRGPPVLIKERLNFYIPIFKEYLSNKNKPILLDIGCGRGEFLDISKDVGLVCEGVDINDIFIDICKSKGHKVTKADALDFLKKQPSQKYDIISAIHFIEHFPFEYIFDLTVEIFRVLKPGGILIYEIPNIENLKVSWFNFWIDPTHNKPLHPELVKYLLKYVGMEDIFIFRLQGKKQINNISFINVIEDSSSDITFIGVKKTNDEKFIESLKGTLKSLEYKEAICPIYALKSFSEELIHGKYRLSDIENELSNMKIQLGIVNSQIMQIYNSKLWKLYTYLSNCKKKLLNIPSVFKSKHKPKFNIREKIRSLINRYQIVLKIKNKIRSIITYRNVKNASKNQSSISYKEKIVLKRLRKL